MILKPPRNEGLKALNKQLFIKQLEILSLKNVPISLIKEINDFKNNEPVLPLLNLKKIRHIVADKNNKTEKTVLLSNSITNSQDLPQTAQNFISKHNLEIEKHTLTLNYDYWTAEDILSSILPFGMPVPNSFETVGQIAHLNLREQYDQYKSIIGQVILSKNPTISVVVNKTSNIHHIYRYFDMEVLAGDESALVTVLKENNCNFKVDFKCVYWNSRLQNEHTKLVDVYFKNGDSICDVMAGIGPFAIPSGKHNGCKVFANDLNPDSFRLLQDNIKLNKVSHCVRGWNMDGREFIKSSVGFLNDTDIMNEMKSLEPPAKKKRKLNTISAGDGKGPLSENNEKETNNDGEAVVDNNETIRDKIKTFDHYVLNLPATAIEFLDAFKGLYINHPTLTKETIKTTPLVHCYCFSKAKEEYRKDVIQRCEQALGDIVSLEAHVHDVRRIRDVAPNKEMICISFRVPIEVLFYDGDGQE